MFKIYKYLLISFLFSTIFFGGRVFADPMKVCYAFNGPIGEWGWNYQQELGRQHVQDHFGDQVKTIFIEGVNEGADAERAIRKLAQQDCKIIFSTTFGFMDPTVSRLLKIIQILSLNMLQDINLLKT